MKTAGGETFVTDILYDWIKNIAFYMVMVTAVMEILPGNGYKRYIQFFTGIITILLILSPVMELTGFAGDFRALYNSREYELEKQQLEELESYYEDISILDFLPEEYSSDIEVEDIEIGKEAESISGTDEGQ